MIDDDMISGMLTATTATSQVLATCVDANQVLADSGQFSSVITTKLTGKENILETIKSTTVNAGTLNSGSIANTGTIASNTIATSTLASTSGNIGSVTVTSLSGLSTLGLTTSLTSPTVNATTSLVTPLVTAVSGNFSSNVNVTGTLTAGTISFANLSTGNITGAGVLAIPTGNITTVNATNVTASSTVTAVTGNITTVNSTTNNTTGTATINNVVANNVNTKTAAFQVRSNTANSYTIQADDFCIIDTSVGVLVTLTRYTTYTFPSASANKGRVLIIKSATSTIQSANNDITPIGGGLLGSLLGSGAKFYLLMSDGTTWQVLHAA